MAETIVGVFKDPVEADAVLHDLHQHGFNREDLNLIAHSGTDQYARPGESGAGAGTGAAIGGAAGVVLGLAALAIPGIGPVVAAGPLAAALTGAGLGAAAGGMLGALSELGVSDEHARGYEDAVKAGGTLVAIHAADNDAAARAHSVLDRHGASHIERHPAAERKVQVSGGVNPHEHAPTLGDEGSPSEFGRRDLTQEKSR